MKKLFVSCALIALAVGFVVAGFNLNPGETFLLVRASYETTEEVTIRHPGTDDPSKFYLINGAAFTKEDWNRIEKSKSVLKDGVSANIWFCRGNPSI